MRVKITPELCSVVNNVATRVGYVPRRRGQVDQILIEIHLRVCAHTCVSESVCA